MTLCFKNNSVETDWQPDVIKRFYHFLGHQELTELRFINRKATHRTFITHTPDSYKIFIQECLKYNGRYQIYVGIHDRKDERGNKESISTIQTLALDIDTIRPKGKPATNYEIAKSYRVVRRIIKKYSKLGFNQPLTIMSGNGYHLLFSIPTIELDDTIRDIVELKIKEWNHRMSTKYSTKHAVIDTTWDLARLIKVPGTLSIKGNPTKCRPHRYSYPLTPIIRHEDKRLLEFLKYMPLPAHKIRREENMPIRNLDLNQLIEQDQKLKILYEGDYSNYKSRSEAELALCCKCVWYGFSEPEIRDIMQDAKIGKWQESTEHYRTITLKKAFSFN